MDVDHDFIIADMTKGLPGDVRVKGSVGSCLFDPFHRGIHGLTSGGESTECQHFDSLGLSNFGAGVDHFLLGLVELPH